MPIPPVVLEWLQLLLRWTHVMAAILWIGDSFLFMWMDASLARPSAARPGTAAGELWMTHSGGFYEVVKHRSLAALPDRLFWFQWQSYATWLSGVALLVVVFAAGGRALLLDGGATLPHGVALALAFALLPLAVLLYELLCRAVRSDAALAAAGLAACAALAWGLGQLYTSRAAFLLVGAALGTVMTANVFLAIVPAQRRMLSATRAGVPVDTTPGARAKRRSVHNHYLTFPVLFTMLASHFASFHAHRFAWAALALLFAGSAGVKLWMNLRGRMSRPLLAGTVACFVAVAALTAPPGESAAVRALASHPPVDPGEAYAIVQARCVACHAVRPAFAGFGPAPAGVTFESPEQMSAWSERILTRVVETRTMPLGNLTGMTDEERVRLGAWARQQRRR